jgi:hypothetical protein
LPGTLVEDGRALAWANVPPEDFTQTIREFTKAGESFEDIVSDHTLRTLIDYEGMAVKLSGTTAPSMWILNNILPVVNPTVLDDDCWQMCLDSLTRSKPGDPTILEVLKHCDTGMARSGLMSCKSYFAFNFTTL